MFKKNLVFICLLASVFSLAACSEKPEGSSGTETETTTTTTTSTSTSTDATDGSADKAGEGADSSKDSKSE